MITNNLYVIAAICGNFWQESTVNPGIWEGLVPGNPGYGLGQWTDNAQVSRRTALFNWLDANGYTRNSGPGQLHFLIYENVWLGNGAGYQSSFANLSDFLTTNSTNLSDLTYEFFHQWEGIDDGTGPTRLQYAQRFLTLFQNDDGIREPWHASNSYNSPVQADANALHILDFFRGETPPEPPEPVEPTEEELIAMLSTARKKKMKGGIWIAW